MKTMDQYIAGFPAQLREALAIADSASLRTPDRDIHNILVSGLGGSGIGANLVGELAADELTVPFSVKKDYHLPAFVGPNTLAIISSYSGNTEETLMAYKQAMARGAWIVCITSGGKVLDIAKDKGFDYIQIPGGMPPRACLGYSMVQQLAVLNKLGFTGPELLEGVRAAANLLDDKEDAIRVAAKDLADYFFGRLPVLYTCDSLGSVAVRFRQQLNENSKVLCWHHVVPEMNHNELVGWRDADERLAVLFIRHREDFDRSQRRIELNNQIIAQYTPHVRELWAEGESAVERALYFIYLTDWASYYLALLRGQDAVEVKVIDFLKGELGS